MKIRVGYELIYEFSPRPAMPMGGLPSRGAGWPFELPPPRRPTAAAKTPKSAERGNLSLNTAVIRGRRLSASARSL
jgi:hypothetical protein